MREHARPSPDRLKHRAAEVAQRLDLLCGDVQRRTARLYELRGRAFGHACRDLRRFWSVRDRLRLHLHAARQCSEERAGDLSRRLDADWRRAQELAESAKAHPLEGSA